MTGSKKPDQKDIASWISKAGKVEQTEEFRYPYVEEFYVEISFASRFALNQIRQLAAESFTDRRTQTREERLDDEKLQLGYAQRIVKGWRGLTVEKLNSFIPGTVDEAITQYELAKKANPELEIPTVAEIRATEVMYSVETAASILSNSVDFMSWVVETAGESKHYSKVASKKEKEYENLKK